MLRWQIWDQRACQGSARAHINVHHAPLQWSHSHLKKGSEQFFLRAAKVKQGGRMLSVLPQTDILVITTNTIKYFCFAQGPEEHFCHFSGCHLECVNVADVSWESCLRNLPYPCTCHQCHSRTWSRAPSLKQPMVASERCSCLTSTVHCNMQFFAETGRVQM